MPPPKEETAAALHETTPPVPRGSPAALLALLREARWRNRRALKCHHAAVSALGGEIVRQRPIKE